MPVSPNALSSQGPAYLLNLKPGSSTPDYLTYLPDKNPQALVAEGNGKVYLGSGPVAKYDTRTATKLWEFGTLDPVAIQIQGKVTRQQMQLLGNGDLLVSGTSSAFFNVAFNFVNPPLAPYNGAPMPFRLNPTSVLPASANPVVQEGIIIRYTPAGTPRFFSFFGE